MDQDYKGEVDDDGSNADENMCNREQQQASSGFEDSEMAITSLDVASPDTTSDLKVSLALQIQYMMALMHLKSELSGKMASHKAKMDSNFAVLNSRIEANKLQKIRSDDQNFGISASNTKAK